MKPQRRFDGSLAGVSAPLASLQGSAGLGLLMLHLRISMRSFGTVLGFLVIFVWGCFSEAWFNWLSEYIPVALR
jgi:hypothetical protein